MHYSVHPSRAFRNRIAKSIGVLVAAALIATLGLPSAAQAQSIAPAGGIVFSDSTDRGFKVTWTTRLATDDDLSWIVTFTTPDGDKVVVDKNTMNERGIDDMAAEGLGTVDVTGDLSLIYDRNDLGTWWFQVDACLVGFDPDPAEDDESPPLATCPAASLETGTAVGYTHGRFPAPENLAASLIPTGVALTWTSEKSDHGLVAYQYSMNADAAKPTWKKADNTSGIQPVKADPGEYAFSVRALGESDNDLNTTDDGEGKAESMGRVASVTITVPTPTPTLPEIAALFLAMLLLGSGAYLLRRRQSGALTHA